MAPIACSRTPKRRLRAVATFAPLLAAPVMSVFVLPARSASPPIMVGRCCAIALRAAPLALRVAMLVPAA